MRAEPTPSSPAELVEQIRSRLEAAGDPDAAPRMQAYMKSVMPFRGVASKPLTVLCREVFTTHRLGDATAWRAAVVDLWDGAGYREERYAAIALAGHRAYADYRTPETLDLYHHFAATGAWWDLVDSVASPLVGPLLRQHPLRVGPTVRLWAEDEDLWVRRTAILCQLGSGEHTDTDLLLHCLRANLLGTRHGDAFFIRKSLGWALREYARTDPAWVRDVVETHRERLAPLTRREALKHLVRAPTSMTGRDGRAGRR